MRQMLTIARLVFVKAWRGNLLPGLLLVMLPLFYAAWAFEAANPGFQTGFLADMSGSVMSLMAGILLLVTGFEHFFWPADQRTPWFFLSRSANRNTFVVGRFLGVAAVILVALLTVAAVFAFMMNYSEGQWFVSLLFTALLVFYEFAMLAAVFQLLAVVSSKLMACGGLLVIFVASHNLEGLRVLAEGYGSLATLLANFLAAFLPDLGLLRGAWFTDFSPGILAAVTLYVALQTLFYLLVSGLILQQKDL